ncbi:MAG: tRNA uridine-5-carboxymethylaminomethyl(34) synthesis enzyme MnmG [Verrucomicrobiae bacterium]|nr:tRNA uridine-5-carboxymethylaminomethyl(34) synthesis enzyme MnmG [Verrucomicrobiae bacterium]
MFTYPKTYEVIVVGGGHAGIEASLASARLGAKVLLLTENADTIGKMSCNPAIGGQGKGQLVREIDALGGEMALATDLTGIQFKILNRSKGPAVWSPRAQCDKFAYQSRQKQTCEKQRRLDVKQGTCSRILVEKGKAIGIETNLGVRFSGKSIVLTTGTFLGGTLHVGMNSINGGRMGEGAVFGLSESLKNLGLTLGRFKTGTPPRLAKSTIDWSKLEIQPGDEPVPFFSFWIDELFHVEQSSGKNQLDRLYPEGSLLARLGKQAVCHITYTTPQTAEIIRKNLHKSPLYSGKIVGIGPRYCPSIEDKIVRFPDKPRHQIFLEPEGVQTEEIYVNGLSTSLPIEVQYELVRSVIGCENAEIVRPAYAVEYDFVYPTQLYPTLEAKACENLFLAGQINGTSGYEEAAAQGLIAGINAARKALGLQTITIKRNEAYIGVLIDDLVTKGATEPYRIFTSLAEHRLLLRQDNADLRLSPLGYEWGLLPRHRYARVEEKKRAIEQEVDRLSQTRLGPETLFDLLRRPEMTYAKLPSRNPTLNDEIIQQVELQAKYASYIARQAAEIERLKSLEDKQIPESFDYNAVIGLRTEARQKLSKIRPATLGQATRIPGVSPADVGLLAVWLKRLAQQPASRG